MSSGLAITRLISRLMMRASSGSHSRTRGSAVAITASLAVTATGRMRKRVAYADDITSVTAAKSIFNGSMCRYSMPTRFASHSASASSVKERTALLPFLVGDDDQRVHRAAVVAPLLAQLLGSLGIDQLVLEQPVEDLGERQLRVGARRRLPRAAISYLLHQIRTIPCPQPPRRRTGRRPRARRNRCRRTRPPARLRRCSRAKSSGTGAGR